MQHLIRAALKEGVSITLSAKSAASGKQGSSHNRAGKLRGPDIFDCHGQTYDGIDVKSMKGQIRGNKAAIATGNNRFIGTFNEQELAELEVAAKTCRAKLIEQRQSAGASSGS